MELEWEPRSSDSRFGYRVVVKSPDRGARPPASMIVAPLLRVRAALAWCPHWQNRDNHSGYFLELMRRLNELMFSKHLVLCLTHSGFDISVKRVFFSLSLSCIKYIKKQWEYWFSLCICSLRRRQLLRSDQRTQPNINKMMCLCQETKKEKKKRNWSRNIILGNLS